MERKSVEVGTFSVYCQDDNSGKEVHTLLKELSSLIKTECRGNFHGAFRNLELKTWKTDSISLLTLSGEGFNFQGSTHSLDELESVLTAARKSGLLKLRLNVEEKVSSTAVFSAIKMCIFAGVELVI